MKINGVVYKIKDGYYLSLFNPINNGISDGIPITKGPYETLQENQISVVEVILKDGNEELNNIDIDDFVENRASLEQGNIFYNIKDLLLYTIKQDITIEKICEQGEFIDVAIDMIKNTIGEKN